MAAGDDEFEALKPRRRPGDPGAAAERVRTHGPEPPDEPQPTLRRLWRKGRRLLADPPTAGRGNDPRQPLPRWYRRQPVVALAIALTSVAILFLAVATVATLITLRLRAALGESYLAQARLTRRSDRPGQRFDTLQLLKQAARLRPSPELRDEAISALTMDDVQPWLQRSWSDPATLGIAFDARLVRFAHGDSHGTIFVRRVADGRELRRIAHPNKPAVSLGFSPDGRLLATRFAPRNRDRIAEFRLYDLETGRVLLAQGPGQGTPCWDFSPDGALLALVTRPVGSDRRVTVVPTADPTEEAGSFEAPPSPYAMAFSPDGKRLAISTGSPGTVWIRDLRSGRTLALPHPEKVMSVAWHAFGTLLAAACADKGVYVWDSARGERVHILQGHEGTPRFVAFNPGGDLLASTGWDRTLRLWDPWTGRLRLVLPASDCPVRFSTDGRRLAFGHDPRSVAVWHVSENRTCRSLRGEPLALRNGLGGLAISPDGRLLASASREGARLWDTTTCRGVASLSREFCELVAFAPDGRALFVGDPYAIHGWPIGGGPGETLQLGPPRRLPAPEGLRPNRGSFDREGQTLAVIEQARNRIVVLSLDGTAKPVFLGPESNLADIALSPDGRWVAVGTWHGTGGVRVWRVAPDTRVPIQLPLHEDARVAFTPDGRHLVTGTAGEYEFWEVATWRPGLRLRREEAGTAGPIAFTGDGRILAIAATSWLVKLVDPTTGHELARLRAPEPVPVSWLAFTPDGRSLAVGGDDRWIQLWDLALVRRELARLGLDWAPDEGLR